MKKAIAIVSSALLCVAALFTLEECMDDNVNGNGGGVHQEPAPESEIDIDLHYPKTKPVTPEKTGSTKRHR